MLIQPQISSFKRIGVANGQVLVVAKKVAYKLSYHA